MADLKGRRLDLIEDQARGFRVPEMDPGAAAMGRVYNAGHMPSAAGNFFAVHRVIPSFNEAEGAVAGTTDLGFNAVFGVVGTQAPSVGDVLIADRIGGRWIAERFGAGSSGIVTTPGCPCGSSPATIFQTSTGNSSAWFNPPLYDDTYDWTANIMGSALTGYMARTLRTDGGRGTAVPYRFIVTCPVSRHGDPPRRDPGRVAVHPGLPRSRARLTRLSPGGLRLPGQGVDAMPCRERATPPARCRDPGRVHGLRLRDR
jgi:hypothetical protein